MFLTRSGWHGTERNSMHQNETSTEMNEMERTLYGPEQNGMDQKKMGQHGTHWEWGCLLGVNVPKRLRWGGLTMGLFAPGHSNMLTMHIGCYIKAVLWASPWAVPWVIPWG